MPESVIRTVLLLLLGVTASAQTLEIAPTTVERGSAGVFLIVLRPADKSIVALQWDLVYRRGIRIETAGIASGSATERAGKSANCVLRPYKGGDHLLSCIVAGGVKPLSAGPIALVRFEAAKTAAKGEMAATLERIIGVLPSLETVPLPGTKALLTVR
jgi:hypothetical protein